MNYTYLQTLCDYLVLPILNNQIKALVFLFFTWYGVFVNFFVVKCFDKSEILFHFGINIGFLVIEAPLFMICLYCNAVFVIVEALVEICHVMIKVHKLLGM